MSRRMLLFLLVPALVGTMVGVGAATLTRPQPTVAQLDGSTDVQAAGEVFDIGFSRTPSGTKKTELPKPRKPKPTEAAEDVTFDVARVLERLRDLKYYLGAIDGEAGSAFTSAVMAFQKVQGLPVDGAVGAETLTALKDPKQPALRGGAANRIEVDLTKQVLYYVEGGSLIRIMPVSSGSGASYTTSSGGTAKSLTPVGSYAVQRKIPGIRVAALGELYDPMYFYQGWAIHGSNSVPAYPASHGCIRVTRADALWLYPRVPVGLSVEIYGGTHVFTAGSSAPGTSTPAGDTDEDTKPSPSPEPKPEPEPDETEPTDEPSPKPSRSPKPSPKPDPEPEPTDPPVEPTELPEDPN